MNRTFRSILLGMTAAVVIAGCTAAGVFFFSKAYDDGVRRASSSRPKAEAVSAPSSATPSKTKSTPSVSVSTASVRELVLVNRDNPTPAWFKTDLTDSFGCKVDTVAAAAFTDMKTDASRDGVTLWISSAYRSTALQSELYQKEIEEYAKTCTTYSEAEAFAAQSVAPPGCSEHETGLALDLNGVHDDFDTTPASRWLSLHAQDYGFILRYPKDKQEITKIKYEPWHYRYVGVENAKAMKKANLCLEEYEAQKTAAVH